MHPVVDSISRGVHLRGVSNTSWSETAMTYLTAAPLGPVVATARGFSSGAAISIPANGLVNRAGMTNMALTVPLDSGYLDSGYQGFSSRESAYPPALLVTTSSMPAPTPAPSPRPIPVPVPEPTGSRADVTIAAVGDMNGEGTTSFTSASGKNGAAIASALNRGSVSAFLGLGDFQYENPGCADYVNIWKRLWGGTKSKLYWISAPNHDWEPGRNEDLDNFMNGQCAGDTTKSAINAQRGFIGNGEPYSFDLGRWHFAMLSSALWRYDLAAAHGATAWLDRDLAAAKAAGKHLVVAYHEPYFTSDTPGHSRASDHRPWVDVIDKHDVRLTLSGSQHNYERSCPVLANDSCTPATGAGTTALQVSTGGLGLRPFTTPSPSYIAKRFSDTHGWLKLVLKSDGSFSWQFMPVSGPGTDSGTRPAP